MSEASLRYLYCLLAADDVRAPDAGLAGLPGCGPTRVEPAADGLWMAIADAPRALYDRASIEATLRDLDRIGACALAHEAVVESFLEAADVIPFKLFTLFEDDARARAHIAAREARLREVVRAVAGCREWSVRLSWNGRNAPATGEPPDEGVGAGRAFLDRKRAELSAGKRGRALAESQAPAVLDRLAGASRAHVRNPIPDAGGARLIADAAFLVPRDEETGFCALVDELGSKAQDDHLEVALTGPWPVYHFVGSVS